MQADRMIRSGPTRRSLLTLAALAAVPLAGIANPATSRVFLEVWKDPNCGCCQDWVVHLEANGFTVKVHDTGNAAMRAKLGVAT